MSVSRRTVLGSLALVAVTGLPLSAGAAVMGKDFTVVGRSSRKPGEPIVIYDFFSYACPHCFAFAPALEDWKAQFKGSKEVQFVTVPVNWSDATEFLSRTYYAFMAMGKMDKLHEAFWDWAIKEEHDWKDGTRIEPDVVAWVSRQGEDGEKFRQVARSFTVTSKVRRALMTWRSMGVDSTPSVVIDGRYLTSPYMAGTRRATLAVMDELLQRARQQ